MYDDYLMYEEEMFYHNDSRSDGSFALIELFTLPLMAVIHLVFFLIRRFDVTNGLLVSGIIQLLNLDKPWDPKVRLGLFIGVVILSVLIQKFSKIGRLLFALFSCTSVAILGGIWKHYDSQTTQYVVMGICFVVTALLNYASWIRLAE